MFRVGRSCKLRILCAHFLLICRYYKCFTFDCLQMLLVLFFLAYRAENSSELLITCCPSSARLSVNFSEFHLLLKNHWANFNQTFQKVLLGKENLSLLKWGARRFPRKYNYENAKIHWRNLNIFFSRTNGLILTKLGTKHFWMKWI